MRGHPLGGIVWPQSRKGWCDMSDVVFEAIWNLYASEHDSAEHSLYGWLHARIFDGRAGFRHYRPPVIRVGLRRWTV